VCCTFHSFLSFAINFSTSLISSSLLPVLNAGFSLRWLLRLYEELESPSSWKRKCHNWRVLTELLSKGKSVLKKAVLLYAMKALGGERKYSSYSFSTSALDGGEWSASHLGRALAPGKGPLVPTVQEAGWAPQPDWTQRLEEKSFCLCRGSNLDCLVVQPVARHYTDWATWLKSVLHSEIIKVWQPKNMTTTALY
jgi:hypothetical protein